MKRLDIVKPDDWHLHLRDTPYLEAVVGDTARQFGRAIVMPNLSPPVRSCADAMAYRERILAALRPTDLELFSDYTVHRHIVAPGGPARA